MYFTASESKLAWIGLLAVCAYNYGVDMDSFVYMSRDATVYALLDGQQLCSITRTGEDQFLIEKLAP